MVGRGGKEKKEEEVLTMMMLGRCPDIEEAVKIRQPNLHK